MKKRNGFVSNSSSCSFILDISTLTEKQKDLILNHYQKAKEINWPEVDDDEMYFDCWQIEDYGINKWKCSTFMDNFDLISWITLKVGVDESKISEKSR
jgi:hypothetical protein